MKKILHITAILSIAVWLLNLALDPSKTWNVWVFRKEFTYVTGIISFAYMSLIMLLAVRPKFLENAFGGLDKMYVVHKWAGIWSIIIGALHYLMVLSGPYLLINFFDKPAKTGPRVEYFLSSFRGDAKQLGEYALYLLLVSLVLTLWNKFSYKAWRRTHKVMPILYLMLVFHTIILSPVSYWTEPAGLFIALCSLVGTVCSIMALFGLIGKQRRFKGEIIQVEKPTDEIINITCRLNGDWAHKAGQYAFLTHNKFEGAHPFTICSSDMKDNTVSFSIKNLGDYTKDLQTDLHIGDSITVEGPYGCFNSELSNSNRQIWIAGGIGVTPFISWLESLQESEDKTKISVDLYYCVRDKTEAVFLPKLEQLCQNFPNIHLNVQYSEKMGFLTVDQFNLTKDSQARFPNIWFCGPNGFAQALKNNLQEKEFPLLQFHQEHFQMR